MKIAPVVVALLSGAPWNAAGGLVQVAPTVSIDGGVIVGTTTQVQGATATVNQFLGIPFASAPTGRGRFSVPKPTSWSQPIDTKTFKPACIQAFSKLTAAWALPGSRH